MVNDIGFHFWIAHLVDLNGLYKKRYSKVESDVGKYAQFSKQICLFLRSVLLPFWKFFDIVQICFYVQPSLQISELYSYDFFLLWSFISCLSQIIFKKIFLRDILPTRQKIFFSEIFSNFLLIIHKSLNIGFKKFLKISFCSSHPSLSEYDFYLFLRPLFKFFIISWTFEGTILLFTFWSIGIWFLFNKKFLLFLLTISLCHMFNVQKYIRRVQIIVLWCISNWFWFVWL